MTDNGTIEKTSNPYDKANKAKAERKALRDAAQARLRAAQKARDWDAVDAAQAEVDALAASAGRKKSKAVYADPMAPDVVAAADARPLRDLLMDHGKAIHPDFGGPVIGGILRRLRAAVGAAGGSLSSAVEREVVRSFHEKECERAHGLGISYVNSVNQVLRRVATAKTVKALELPHPGPELFLGRREPEDVRSRFEREWAEYVKGAAPGGKADDDDDDEA